MKKALLIGINSKYIHTNLAIRDLYECSKGQVPQQLEMMEFTINQHPPMILDEIYRQKADILLFSCYIWNIEMVTQLIATYRKIAPNTTIILGGPEVSYHAAAFLKAHPAVDYLIKGEGEATLPALLCALAAEPTAQICALQALPGILYRSAEQIIENTDAPAFPMELLPFPYPDLEQLTGKILYFESSRGCPFRCSYCLSSIAGKVRLMPLEKVFAYLTRFLDAKVPQVKFVDRTFNCNKTHALAIWQFLKEHDNGVTNFHFEVSAHLFDRETLDFLRTVRPEQFQLEVGVQSTNPDTITQIKRTTDTEKLLGICQEIDSYQNIHQHLDLIAGLPFEDKASFARSFDTVFAIRPQQLQLGFLKILKGSQMEREAAEHEIEYNHLAPFEVLRTKWLSYDDILLLKGVEDMVERYYNSGRFRNTLQHLLADISSPYTFFEALGCYYFEQGYHLLSIPKERAHSILKAFYEAKYNAPYSAAMKEVALFDLCLKEKPKKLPDFILNERRYAHKDETHTFFHTAEHIASYLPHYAQEAPIKISRLAHLQGFTHDVTDPALPERLTFILFDYDHPDLLGNARWWKVTL
ncbi:MAG: B12-binding domain-containing radical SAM protein [Faecalibacterium sp.]